MIAIPIFVNVQLKKKHNVEIISQFYFNKVHKGVLGYNNFELVIEKFAQGRSSFFSIFLKKYFFPKYLEI